MKIKQIQLFSDKLHDTEKFYNEVLKIATHAKADQSVSFKIGETELIFWQSENISPSYHLAIDIPRNKLQEAFAWIEARVKIEPVTPESQISKFDNWNAESFYFYDNNMNLLELICRHDLHNQSDIAFSSQQLLYVSEIGIVTSDAEQLAKELMDAHNLEVYSKQPALKEFVALGDETGLLILVKEGRNWFPTTVPAKSFWSKIVIENTKTGAETTIEQ